MYGLRPHVRPTLAWSSSSHDVIHPISSVTCVTLPYLTVVRHGGALLSRRFVARELRELAIEIEFESVEASAEATR